MTLSPWFGIGQTVKNASGQPVVIKSKRDMIEVGKTYKVFHFDTKARKPGGDSLVCNGSIIFQRGKL